MAKTDYYKTLGLPRSASDKEIKQTYRRLARRHHPDVNPGDQAAEARFKEINEAYEVLSDPEKRKKYDQYGENWRHADQFTQAGVGGQGPFVWRREGSGAPQGVDLDLDDESLGGIFGSLFGRTGRRPAAMRGQNIQHPVEVTLEQAYHGTTRQLQLSDPLGGPRRLEVKIPAGVRTGSRVHIAGAGGAGFGSGPAGDLWLVVTVLPHARFERKGDDMYVEVAVPLVDAVLGTEVEVPTLSGKLALKVPPETQNGQLFRLPGQGMPKLGGSSTGDLYARVKVVLPTPLTERERELFREMKDLRR